MSFERCTYAPENSIFTGPLTLLFSILSHTSAKKKAERLKGFKFRTFIDYIVQELCESRGGRPGLSVLTNLLVSVDVKNY